MAQDTSTKTMTAPLAVIKINGYASGFMRNVRLSENINRAEVQGLGSLILKEAPATRISCSLTCDFFFISLARPEARAFLRRDQGKDVLINTLILAEIPIQVQIFRKIATETSADGVVTGIDPEGKTVANISDFYPNSQNWDISEQQVSGMNVSGIYFTPVFSNE